MGGRGAVKLGGDEDVKACAGRAGLLRGRLEDAKGQECLCRM